MVLQNWECGNKASRTGLFPVNAHHPVKNIRFGRGVENQHVAAVELEMSPPLHRGSLDHEIGSAA